MNRTSPAAFASEVDRLDCKRRPTLDGKHHQDSVLLALKTWYFYFIARIIPTSN
ncbi:hypothetical protein QUA70_18645 [Microcoleus sp. LAD1_D5]|uniref:hypothetical protein n=1 Tax=unclassified Microcoleus TaxID=2642155 RepID=UPI002FD14F95